MIGTSVMEGLIQNSIQIQWFQFFIWNRILLLYTKLCAIVFQKAFEIVNIHPVRIFEKHRIKHFLRQ